VLSEESAEVPYTTRCSWSRFWLVDPLDGTKEFVKRNGEFTVNIALIDAGRPVFGVVYAPVLDIMYLGLAGAGAYKIDGNPESRTRARFVDALQDLGQRADALPRTCCARNPTDPGPVRVVASRSHRNAETQAFIDDIEARVGAVELVSIGSSLKLCLVAEGAADIYPRIAPTMEWDTAAAQAVVEAAGGTVTRYQTSHALQYNKPDLHNPYFVVTSAERPSAAGVSNGDI
jgi:3'(2'), 5'-bisphosphate nucleotidase